MGQVIFVRRQGAYWPGANPELAAEEYAKAISSGVAVPFSEETRMRARRILAHKTASGVQAEEIDLSDFDRIDKLERDLERANAEAAAKAAKATDHKATAATPVDGLGLAPSIVHSLTAAGLKDIDALAKYADEHENFRDIDGIGESSSVQIAAVVKKHRRE